MKLKTQLALAGALTLLVPLVAYRSVLQMDTALRDIRAADLEQKHQSAVTLLTWSGLLDGLNIEGDQRQQPSIVAEQLNHTIVLDGYADDWTTLEQPGYDYELGSVSRFANNQSRLYDSRNTSDGSNNGDSRNNDVSQVTGLQTKGLQVRLAVSPEHLYLFFSVRDSNVIYHDPNIEVLSSGDHIELFVADEENDIRPILFRAVAPGEVIGRYYGRRFEGLRPILKESQYRGVWAATSGGFQLELQIPRPSPNSRFGFAFVDRGRLVTDDQDRRYLHWTGSTNPLQPESAGHLVYPAFELQGLLQQVVPAGSRARLFDREGQLRADVHRLYETPANRALIDPDQSHIFNALLFRFFEWLISTQKLTDDRAFNLRSSFELEMSELPETDIAATAVRSYKTLQRDHVIGRLGQLEDSKTSPGWLLYESNEDNTNAFTSSAMVRLFSLLTLFSLLVALSLLIFASWLSFRIRRLSQATRHAVTGDGRVGRSVTPSVLQDEIGDLSRDFASLVDRSAGYTQYLESLASKLSHELRTPLSVVQTSLENLDKSALSEAENRLIERAQGGSKQLGRIVKSMGEAARLEHSVQQADFVEMDLCDWLQGVFEVYGDLYPAVNLIIRKPDHRCYAYAAPDLLQQALDKLIDNAVEFTPQNGEVELALSQEADELLLSVRNQGSRLPEELLDRLFEPMVTDRTSSPSAVRNPHLGLGLYIVKLIAAVHRGSPFAENSIVSGERGVQIGFRLPSAG